MSPVLKLPCELQSTFLCHVVVGYRVLILDAWVLRLEEQLQHTIDNSYEKDRGKIVAVNNKKIIIMGLKAASASEDVIVDLPSFGATINSL